jgi:hypothetical protein
MTAQYQTRASAAISAAVAVPDACGDRLRMSVARTAPAPLTGRTGCP